MIQLVHYHWLPWQTVSIVDVRKNNFLRTISLNFPIWNSFPIESDLYCEMCCLCCLLCAHGTPSNTAPATTSTVYIIQTQPTMEIADDNNMMKTAMESKTETTTQAVQTENKIWKVPQRPQRRISYFINSIIFFNKRLGVSHRHARDSQKNWCAQSDFGFPSYRVFNVCSVHFRIELSSHRFGSCGAGAQMWIWITLSWARLGPMEGEEPTKNGGRKSVTGE